jgi:hypothetical protein
LHTTLHYMHLGYPLRLVTCLLHSSVMHGRHTISSHSFLQLDINLHILFLAPGDVLPISDSDMSTQNSPRLGWIGLGSMGLAMSLNIQKHIQFHSLPPLRYWNRTISRGDTLKELGGIPCQAIGELVQCCDIVFISVHLDLHTLLVYNLNVRRSATMKR